MICAEKLVQNKVEHVHISYVAHRVSDFFRDKDRKIFQPGFYA